MRCLKQKKVSYIFDEFLDRTHFEHNAKFSNKKRDLKNFIKKSKSFSFVLECMMENQDVIFLMF